jgi:ribosomal protein S18 acetylase RimI-like enzyme
LHADSWRRNYRGAYPDEFLDNEVEEERLTVWTRRLEHPVPTVRTVVAERAGIVGFVHVVLDEDPAWGSLIDNLHVANGAKRQGIGASLMAHAAQFVIDERPGTPLYLLVNHAAQAFYNAGGGTCVETRSRAPQPGTSLRYAWPDPARLLSRGADPTR